MLGDCFKPDGIVGCYFFDYFLGVSLSSLSSANLHIVGTIQWVFSLVNQACFRAQAFRSIPADAVEGGVSQAPLWEDARPESP